MSDRPVFYERAMGAIQAAIKDVAAEIPELEGAAVVFLWRMPDQTSVPSAMIQGAAGGLRTPDQLIRLHRAVLQLTDNLVGMERVAVDAIAEMAAEFARRADHARTEPQAPGPRGGPDAPGEGRPDEGPHPHLP